MRTSTSRQLRARSHGTYLDDSEGDSASDAATGSGTHKPQRKNRSFKSKKSHRARRQKTPVREGTTDTPSPSLSPFTPESVDPDSSDSVDPEIRLASFSPAGFVRPSDREQSPDVSPSAYNIASNRGLPLLLGLCDAWLPFVDAWTDGDLKGLRSFATDVRRVVDHLTDEIEEEATARRRSAMLRAEKRRTDAYNRYAAERDARKEVSRLAKRLFAGPSSSSTGGFSDEVVDFYGDGGGDVWGEGNSSSSDESEGESLAMDSYLRE
ncbi:hypothetical protein P7C70_g5702, partial [Phenoliferia sp. Uapishka_3]